VLLIHNTWLLKHFDKLSPAPQSIFTIRSVDEAYPSLVRQDFTSGNEVFAVPLSIDTLSLFYNRDLLDQAGIPFPPKTWEELVQIVPRLTKVNQAGLIEKSAVALGGIRNVAHAADILSLLMIQSGSSMVETQRWETTFQLTTLEGGRSPGEEALRFYLQFAKAPGKTYTWGNDEANSLDAFAEGKTAMVFAYAGDLASILAKSPHLNYRLASMLQPATQGERADYASYWGLAVSRTSRRSQEAWQLIAYLTDLSQARTYMRRLNQPPARRELIREVLEERLLGIFARQALTARSWYQPDPIAVENIFRDMIESATVGRATPQQAVRQAADEIDLLFEKFR
jgi:multiple sugar transport system substrate-binding protein